MDRSDLEKLVERCEVAKQLFDQDGCHDVMTAFNIANHLHLHCFFKEAAIFYQEAIQYRQQDPNSHPQEKLLLQVKLLCLVKADIDLDEADCQRLEALSPALANYVAAVEKYYHHKANAFDTLKQIDCTFEQFHTGEEIDSIYVGLIYRGFIDKFLPDLQGPRLIPSNLFFYWDKDVPDDVKQNIEHHKEFQNYKVELFDQEKAADWLYQYYGREAQSIFLNARHPAEAADILRVHVINLYGGFWVDADLKIISEDILEQHVPKNYDSVFFLTNGNFIHNDFFGSTANNAILEDCLLSIYRNCYQYGGLFISYKTGPGVFMRALNRSYYRCLNYISDSYPSVRLLTPEDFNTITEQYPVAYKTAGTWSSV